jgi:hypothetical protein
MAYCRPSVVVFTLDQHGKGISSFGTIAIKLKRKTVFPGGEVAFKIMMKNDDWKRVIIFHEISCSTVYLKWRSH